MYGVLKEEKHIVVMLLGFKCCRGHRSCNAKALLLSAFLVVLLLHGRERWIKTQISYPRLNSLDKLEIIKREISAKNTGREYAVRVNSRNIKSSNEESEGQGVAYLPNCKEKRLPQCIIIGMRKAGTKALLTFLGLNEHIRAAGREIGFFSDDEVYSKGLEWYRKQMPYSCANQITIEKTPRYVMYEKVPDRILNMNSSIKLILIVKEPVLRAISDYAQNQAKVGNDREYLTFEEYAIDKETGEVNRDYPPIDKSIYYKHVQKWVKKFPRKQLLILDGDSLVQSPFEELRKVEDFLGLKSEIREDMFYFNFTKGFHCAKRNKDSEPICLGVNKGRKHPDVSPNVVEKLQAFFRPWNKKFFKLVKQSFKWR